MNALANMGANMSAMLAGTSPLTETQPDNAEGSEIGVDEMPQSMAPANPPVTDSIQDVPAKSTESAECNGGVETPLTSEQEDGAKPSTPAEVNINIDKTQGNAIYSSLLGLQNTLDNFQLDVKQDSLREVVYEAIKDADPSAKVVGPNTTKYGENFFDSFLKFSKEHIFGKDRKLSKKNYEMGIFAALAAFGVAGVVGAAVGFSISTILANANQKNELYEDIKRLEEANDKVSFLWMNSLYNVKDTLQSYKKYNDFIDELKKCNSLEEKGDKFDEYIASLLKDLCKD